MWNGKGSSALKIFCPASVEREVALRKVKGKRNSQKHSAVSRHAEICRQLVRGGKGTSMSWANSKVSSAKIINHGADKDRRCWQARIGFTRHPPRWSSSAREETVMPEEKRGIGMPSRICETNGRLPNSKRMREDERRNRENLRYQSGKVMGHTWSAPRRQDVVSFLPLFPSLSF